MAKVSELEKEFQHRLEQEARKKGLDPATTVHLEQRGKTIFVKWGEVEVALPAPSEQAVDS